MLVSRSGQQESHKPRRSRVRLMALLGATLVVTVAGCGGGSSGSSGSSAATVANTLPGKGKTVTVCDSVGAAGMFSQLIPARALERLGYTVKMPVTLSVPVMHQSIATGDCTFAVDEWVPLMNPFYGKVKNEVTRLGPATNGATQGYLIDKKTADTHHITSLTQLKDPAVAKIFDADGDGKADLCCVEPGWGAELVAEHELTALGLDKTVELIRGEFDALIADTFARYKRGEPILYYTDSPNWTTAVLKPGQDVVYLHVPKSACPSDQPCGSSTTGFGENNIAILANSKFLQDNPAAKAALNQVKIPLKDVSAGYLSVYRGQKTPAAIGQQVDKWIAAHRSEFDGWVKAGQQAAQQPQ
jgi:glycine betaine/proline transport system substrate-binding protein